MNLLKKIVEQYYVDGYGIYLYLPVYKLAAECDKFCHGEQDIGHEVKEQNDIENKLGCTSIRYHYDGKGFSIFNVISQIYQFI